MSVQTATTLKAFFESGDVPTEAQFIDLIDSTTNTLITGAVTVNGSNVASVVTNANLTGDVESTGNATTVKKINGTSMAGLATGILKNTTTTGVPSIAVAGDFPTLNQNTSGNAGTVTTNANLTGDVTSTGNATTIGDDKVTYAMNKKIVIRNLLSADLTANAYTLIANDAGKVITIDNSNTAATVNLPGDGVVLPIGTQIIFVDLNGAAGRLTFAAVSSGVIRSAGTLLSTAELYSSVSAIKISANTWSIAGSLS